MSRVSRPTQLVDALAEILAAAFDARGLRGFLVGEPRGAEILRAVPRRAGTERLAQEAARVLFEVGVDNALLARLAGARPAATTDIAAFAVALREAGMLRPSPDHQIQGLASLPLCPTLIAGHRSLVAGCLVALEPAEARVALVAATSSQLEGLLAALLREPQLYAGVPGGVSFLAPTRDDDVLCVLRSFGVAVGDAVLAFAGDRRAARARMSTRVPENGLLVLLDRGAPPELLRELAACVGPEVRVLLATSNLQLARQVAPEGVQRAEPVSRGLAQDILMWWAWGAEGAEAPLKAIASALPQDPDTLELAGRVMAGPPPLLEPAELLAALVLAALRWSWRRPPGPRRSRAVRPSGGRASAGARPRGLRSARRARPGAHRRGLGGVAAVGGHARRAPGAGGVRAAAAAGPTGRWMLPGVVYQGSRRWRERNGLQVRTALRSASVVITRRLGELLRAWKARDLPALAARLATREAARGLWREAFRWGRSDRKLAEVCTRLTTLPAGFLAWFLPAEESLIWAEGALLGGDQDEAAAMVDAQLRVARVCRSLGAPGPGRAHLPRPLLSPRQRPATAAL